MRSQAATLYGMQRPIMAVATTLSGTDAWGEFVATSLNEQEDDEAFLHYSDLQDAGQPVQALDFPTPMLFAAEVTSVRAVDHRNGRSRSIENVLMKLGENIKALSKDSVGGEDRGLKKYHNCSREPDRAYLLRKKISKTTYGMIRVAVVLRRRPDHETGARTQCFGRAQST